MSDQDGARTSLDIAALRTGMRLPHDLFDERDRLLLAGGMVITEQFLEVLRSRGIEQVQTQAVPEELQEEVPDQTPPRAEAPLADRFADVEAPADAAAFALLDRTRPPKARLDADAFEEASQAATRHAEALLDSWEGQGDAWLGATHGTVAGSAALDVGPAAALLQDVVPVMAMDIDLAAVMVGMSKSARQPILEHGVRTALVAMHLAQQVGYPKERIVDAGVAGLLADVGMARLPESILKARRPLTPNEWLDVRRHPAYSADLLEHAGVSRDVRISIYQHHERLDGSGYPHGRRGFFLHPLARLLAVADTYAALSETRHHRPAQSAHHAVKAVLIGVRSGKLDTTVGKLLVDTVGLFPVGLRVDVAERESKSPSSIAAQVLRSPETKPDRPILVLLDEQGEPTKKKLDLSVRDELAITKVYGPNEKHVPAEAA
ncbi:MAG: HD domain-containing phosphohydrolase [Planctomycetota bacterium]